MTTMMMLIITIIIIIIIYLSVSNAVITNHIGNIAEQQAVTLDITVPHDIKNQ